MKFMIALLVSALVLVGCGSRVEIPPGHVGKVLSPTGLQSGTHRPSSFRLPVTMPWDGRYYLVLVEASDQAVKEQCMVFMPQDKLNLTFDVRLTMTIPADDDQRIASIFSRISPNETNDSTYKRIDFTQVYETYAQPVVREKAREVVAKYKIEQIMSNREAIGDEIEAAIVAALKNTPIVVASCGLADVQPPQVIITAQEAAKEREIAIQRAEAEKMVKLTEAQAALEVARKQQEVDLVEAETQARVNEVLAQGITQAFVTQRSLKILETMASSPNKIFIVPDSAFTNPAFMLGITNEALKETLNK